MNYLTICFFLFFLGDIFSCHAVDNPKPQSELAMLRQYGPDVPEPILQKLVAAFGELRSLADQGIINYPYSTREVVNIVKHLQVQHIRFHWKLEFITTNCLMCEAFRKRCCHCSCIFISFLWKVLHFEVIIIFRQSEGKDCRCTQGDISSVCLFIDIKIPWVSVFLLCEKIPHSHCEHSMQCSY